MDENGPSVSEEGSLHMDPFWEQHQCSMWVSSPSVCGPWGQWATSPISAFRKAFLLDEQTELQFTYCIHIPDPYHPVTGSIQHPTVTQACTPPITQHSCLPNGHLGCIVGVSNVPHFNCTISKWWMTYPTLQLAVYHQYLIPLWYWYCCCSC